VGRSRSLSTTVAVAVTVASGAVAIWSNVGLWSANGTGPVGTFRPVPSLTSLGPSTDNDGAPTPSATGAAGGTGSSPTDPSTIAGTQTALPWPAPAADAAPGRPADRRAERPQDCPARDLAGPAAATSTTIPPPGSIEPCPTPGDDRARHEEAGSDD